MIKTNLQKLARMVGATNGDLTQFLSDADENGFCDICVTDNEIVTLCNRRMYRDEKDRNNNRLRQQRYRTKHKHNKKITPPSSSSSSISYKYIVEYLNKKTGKNFQHTAKETRRFIRARWKEGYREKDFEKVIDAKTEKWSPDPKMVDYLRPATLFGTKFESYLNEKPNNNTQPTLSEEEKWLRKIGKA